MRRRNYLKNILNGFSNNMLFTSIIYEISQGVAVNAQAQAQAHAHTFSHFLSKYLTFFQCD